MMIALLLGLAAVQANAAPPPEAEALIANCNAHKFETTVKKVVDGKPRKSQVKLCGKAGQSDAAWVFTLKDAVAKVAANDKMPGDVRVQISTALDAEIERIEANLRVKEAMAAPLKPRATFSMPGVGEAPNAVPSPPTEY